MFNFFNRKSSSAKANPEATRPVVIVEAPVAVTPVEGPGGLPKEEEGEPCPFCGAPNPVGTEECLTCGNTLVESTNPPTIDEILEHRIAKRLEEARKRREVAKAAEMKTQKLAQAMAHTEKLKASYMQADKELVNAMKAEANALAALDRKIDKRLSQENSVIEMLNASNKRMENLRNGDLFAESFKRDVWGTPKQQESVEDFWGPTTCPVEAEAEEDLWGSCAVAETFQTYEDAFVDGWEQFELEA